MSTYKGNLKNCHRSNQKVGRGILVSWGSYVTPPQEICGCAFKLYSVYLQTDPEVALRRVKERSRGEEHLINEQYIQDLHHLHEDWLTHQKFPVHAPVVVVDANKDIQGSVEHNKFKTEIRIRT